MSCLRTAFLFTWRLWAGKGDQEINICFAKSPNLRKGVLNEHRSNKDTAQGLGSICRSPILRHTRTLTTSAPPALASPTASSLHEACALSLLIFLLPFSYRSTSPTSLFFRLPIYKEATVSSWLGKGKTKLPIVKRTSVCVPQLFQPVLSPSLLIHLDLCFFSSRWGKI